MALDPKAQAALALHRFGLGPRAGSVAAIASDPRGALIAELDRADAGRIASADLLHSGAAARAAVEFQQAQRQLRREAGGGQKKNALPKNAQAKSMQPMEAPPSATPQESAHNEHPATERPAEERRASASHRRYRAAGALPHRSQGAARCRARRRPGLQRAAGLVLVEPFLRLRRQGRRAADRRRVRARGDPRQCARPLRRHAARGREPSGDADLSRQRALDRSELAGRPQPQPRPQREPRARDPGAAYARRAQRLHARRRHQFRQGDHRLDGGAAAAGSGSWAAPSPSTRACTRPVRRP